MPRKGNVIKVSKSSRRAAARKKGWNQAKQATKGLIIDDPVSLVKAGAEEVRKGAAAGYGVASTGGLITGAVKQAVKNIPTNIKRVGEVVKGTLRGIFNHPDWYKYQGTLSIPASNIFRPFSPKSLKSVTPTWDNTNIPGKISGAGAGVAHVSQIAVAFNDMRNDESFKLATLEAFKAIRFSLKSNLPYKQNAYDNYVNSVCSIYVKAKAIEKALGLYDVTRADIPEFAAATQTVPLNTFERGVLTPTNIAMLRPDVIADSKEKFKKLAATIKNIYIPRKLAEYLSWWVGSLFIDQAAPNPQIYMTMLRKAYVYEATDYDTVGIKSSWDIATGSIQDVIDEAENLLDVFGIMNADIGKTGGYGVCEVVLPYNYSPIYLNDPEFFSILINAYSVEAGSAPLSQLFDKEYIRVDALEELGEANLVGMSNALSTWAGMPTLVTIMSQAAYLRVDNSMSLPAFEAVFGKAGQIVYDANTYEADGAWLQITGVDTGNGYVAATDSATTGQITATAGSRAPAGVTPTATTLSLPDAVLATDYRAPYYMLLSGTNNLNESVDLRITKATGVLSLHNNATGVDVPLTFTGTITVNGQIITITAGTASIVSTYNPYVLAFNQGGWYLSGISLIMTYTISATAQAVFQPCSTDFISWFCELIDYHIPVIYSESFSVFVNGTECLYAARTPILLKECYKPMLFNRADIEAVLYWMYLGLFSMS